MVMATTSPALACRPVAHPPSRAARQQTPTVAPLLPWPMFSPIVLPSLQENPRLRHHYRAAHSICPTHPRMRASSRRRCHRAHGPESVLKMTSHRARGLESALKTTSHRARGPESALKTTSHRPLCPNAAIQSPMVLAVLSAAPTTATATEMATEMATAVLPTLAAAPRPPVADTSQRRKSTLPTRSAPAVSTCTTFPRWCLSWASGRRCRQRWAST